MALQVLVECYARELLHCKGVGHEGRPVRDWITFSVRIKRARIGNPQWGDALTRPLLGQSRMDQTLIGDEDLIVWISVILAFAALEEGGL